MKRRVNKYIEARKRQQGGIVKAQSNQFRTQLRFDIPTYNFPSPDLPLSYDDFVRRMSMKEQPLTDDEYAKLRQKSAEMATQMNYYQESTTPVGSDRMQQIQQNTMQQAQYEYYRQRLKAEEEAKRRQPAVLKQWDGISYSPTEQELNDAANRFMMNPQSAFDTGYADLQSEVKGIPGGIDYDTYDLWNSMSKEDLENAKREWNHIKIMVGLAAGAVAGAEPIGKGISKGINKGMQFLQNPLSTTVNIGTKTIPQIGKYTWLPTTAAVGDGLYNTAMTIDGFYNLFTDNGVQKTVRLAKDGDVGGAIKSGVGDIFNIIPALSSYKYSKPIQTFIGDLKYAKRYFDHHKGNMNPIEIGYNILRPEFRLLHRASAVNETINPMLATLMWFNGGIYNPKIKTFLRDTKAVLSAENSWHNWHIKKREESNLAALYGQQLLANTNIGQKLLPSHIRLKPLSFDELSRVKTHPSQIKSEFKDVPFYQLTGNLSQKTFVPFDWRSVEKENSGLIFKKPLEVANDDYYSLINDNIAGHFERSMNGLNEVLDIQRYTPTSNSTGYKSRWINRPDNNYETNVKTIIMKKLQDMGIRWIDVAGDNYGLYKSVPQSKID